MTSIFTAADQKLNAPGKFWTSPTKESEIDIKKNKIFRSYLYLPTSASGFRKENFALTTSSIYSLDSSKKPESMSILTWKRIEPFIEDNGNEERFGFRIFSGEVFQDFYTADSSSLEKWLGKLSKVCILQDIEMDFKVEREIGAGNYGEVHLGKEIETGEFFAIKSISKGRLLESSIGIENLIGEIQILRKLEHPNLVKLHKVYESEDFVYLVQDYIPSKDLCKRTLEMGNLNEESAVKVIREVLETLHYLKTKDVAHRDIKPENILVTENFDVKVIDFGLACRNIKQGGTAKCGSPGYVAPEILEEKVYGAKVDVFSAGVVLYVMLSGVLPFAGNTEREVLYENKMCNIAFPSFYWLGVSCEAKDLILKMTNPNPSKRLTALEALSHPWFCKFNSGSPKPTRKSSLTRSQE